MGHKDNLKRFIYYAYKRIDKWIKKFESEIVEKDILDKEKVYEELFKSISEEEKVDNYHLQIEEERKGLYKIRLRIDTSIRKPTKTNPYNKHILLYPIDIGKVYTYEFFL